MKLENHGEDLSRYISIGTFEYQNKRLNVNILKSAKLSLSNLSIKGAKCCYVYRSFNHPTKR